MIGTELCPRCVMRCLNIDDNELIKKAEKEIELELVTRWPSLVLADNTNGEKKAEENGLKAHCKSCLGLLRDESLKDWLDAIVQTIKKEKYIFKNFKLLISQPVQFLFFEKYVLIKYKKEIDSFSRPGMRLEIKDIIKIVLEPKLREILAADPVVNEAELNIDLVYKHAESETDMLPRIEEKFPTCFVKAKRQLEKMTRKRARNDLTIFTLASIRSASERMGQNDLGELLEEKYYQQKVTLDEIKIQRASIFVAGRYNKFSRNLSQTPWILDGERKSEMSVQEYICEPIMRKFCADSNNFSSSGREDIDVRMLGKGRPFLVEFFNPRTFFSSPDKMRSLESEINESTNEIKIRDLQLISKAESKMLKEGEEEKTKSYSAICYAKILNASEGSKVISIDTVKSNIHNLSTMKDLKIDQKTPLRVLHRRNLAVRTRTIHSMSAQVIDVTEASKTITLPEILPSEYILFKLDLTTQAGTYVKDFVHGDFGRTVPNLETLISADTDILCLDVNAVNLDWPPSLEDMNEN